MSSGRWEIVLVDSSLGVMFWSRVRFVWGSDFGLFVSVVRVCKYRW